MSDCPLINELQEEKHNSISVKDWIKKHGKGLDKSQLDVLVHMSKIHGFELLSHQTGSGISSHLHARNEAIFHFTKQKIEGELIIQF
jgi:hypothetical protein